MYLLLGCVCSCVHTHTKQRGPGKARVKSKFICNTISHVFQRKKLTKFQREKNTKKKKRIRLLHLTFNYTLFHLFRAELKSLKIPRNKARAAC